MALIDDVCAYIKERNHVSFAELARQWPEHFAVKDGLAISLGENVVLWHGLSKNGADVVEELRKLPMIELKPCELLVYLIDGYHLGLPLVKQYRAYKRPHWLPITFCVKEL